MHGVENYNKTEVKHIVVEAKVNHGTQYYRLKGGGGVPPPPPPPNHQGPLKELIKFYESYSH